ncbi:MAG: hypothetical protein WC759_03425 [Candidatus Micrarchaeia archaeon]|jgi:hypothetical protein
MAVLRQIRWGTYLVAFVISVLLFTTGILIGTQLVQTVNAGLENDLQSLRSRTAELELLMLLKEDNSTELCGFYQGQLQEFDVQTTAFGQKLDILEKNRGRGDEAVLELKREYMLMEVRDFLLVKKINEGCPQKIDTMLYFYSNTNCPDCERQGEIGPPLKQEKPDLMIYAFDADLQVSVVNALMHLYSVKEYPALVVNGKTLEGYRSKEEVKNYLP